MRDRGFKYALPGSLLLLAFTFIIAGFNRGNPHVYEVIKMQLDNKKNTVILNNQDSLLPLQDLKGRRIASVNAGFNHSMVFDSLLRNYADVSSFAFSPDSSAALDARLANFNTIVLQLSPASVSDPRTIDFIYRMRISKEVIIALFGNSGYLSKLDVVNSPVLWTADHSADGAAYAAQVIFGGIAANGRLQDSISPVYRAGSGYSTEKIRLKYSIPEEIGMNSNDLNKIDRIMDEAISARATPGAVVMVVKDGHVIFEKAYGNHTYEGGEPTRVNDIYDLASVTKTAATTIAAMSLYDQKKLDLSAPIGEYLPMARGSNKGGIPVREAMLHQAGFVNLDFYSKVRAYDKSADSSANFPTKIAENYFLRKGFYEDVMLPSMIRSPLPTRGKYVYSDISMFMMKEIIEHQAGTSLDKYVLEEFYKPLGMRKAGYNPLDRFSKADIVPTERDTYFRKTLLQGEVHDPGAALVGGVSGHAGLFSSANDLAILNQMLLNGGSYGGVSYIKPETVELFTSKQSGVSRRGLGFDRFDPNSTRGYPSKHASSATYGHTGYTGTSVWVDPAHDLIYIFLSNRVYPSASTKLNSMNVRPRIQDAIYEAIFRAEG